MFKTDLGIVTVWQFPDDAVEGKIAFLDVLHNPAETWILAYAFTMPELADEVIAAHKDGVKFHIYVDHSQTGNVLPLPGMDYQFVWGADAEARADPVALALRQRTVIQNLVEAGVEVTIGTSYAGPGFIAHEKGFATADDDCWEGSTNFSESAWSQINSAMEFVSPEWAQHLRNTIKQAVEYAWAHEKSYQLMTAKPDTSGW